MRDAAAKQALAELYLPPWKAYYNAVATGDVNVGALPRSVQDADYFAEHFASVPAIVVVCAELAGLHPTDTELGRLSVVGGGSIYPTVQNLCLALRDQGVGTAVTTLLCIERAEGPRAAGDPGRLHHGVPHRRRLPGEAVPDGAHAVAGRGDRLRRGVRQAAVRVTAGQHRAPIGRATIGDQLRRHARTQPRQGRVRDLRPGARGDHLRRAGRPRQPVRAPARRARGGTGRRRRDAGPQRRRGGRRLLRRAQARRGLHRGQPDVPGARGGLAARPRRARRSCSPTRRSPPSSTGRPRCCSAPTSTPSWPRSPRPSPTPRSTRTTSRCSSTPAAPPRCPRAC